MLSVLIFVSVSMKGEKTVPFNIILQILQKLDIPH